MVAMDLPFVLYIPFGRGAEDANRKIPPASLSLGGSRTAETYYELVVTVQQGHTHQHKYSFPVPIQRFDTLSTFGMYNKPEYKTAVSDNIVSLGMSLPRWSYGPSDPITVYVKLAPNPDWMSKARKVTVDKLTVTIEEEITFNPEGDEPTKKVNRLDKRVHVVKTKLSETGFTTNMALVFPSKSIRDADGIIRREKPGFPLYEVSSFTTTSTLYRIEFFLCIKVRLHHLRGERGGFSMSPKTVTLDLTNTVTRPTSARRAISRYANPSSSAPWTTRSARRSWMQSSRPQRTRRRSTRASRRQGPPS